jgi:outer membrane protein OmpA-like peptidoglycan-associated protein
MRAYLRFSGLSLIALLVVLVGCATVPTVVPQALIDARSALAIAKKTNADILVPSEYAEALRQLDRAEATFSAEQSIATVEEQAFEAQAYAQIAEARARVRIATQEYETVQQALITQQSMLTALMQKQQYLDQMQARIQQTEADKQAVTAAAAVAAVEQAKQLEEERKKREAAEREAEMLRKAQKIRNAQVKMEARGLVISLSGKVLFDTGSSKLQPGAKSALDQVAEVLNEYTDYHIRIEGHTDSTGNALSNNMLSQARAESVLNYLHQKGVAFDSMTAVGIGSTRAIATNKTPEGRQLNRRVEIILEKKTETQKTP